jgi:hypothetical protein
MATVLSSCKHLNTRLNCSQMTQNNDLAKQLSIAYRGGSFFLPLLSWEQAQREVWPHPACAEKPAETPGSSAGRSHSESDWSNGHKLFRGPD